MALVDNKLTALNRGNPANSTGSDVATAVNDNIDAIVQLQNKATTVDQDISDLQNDVASNQTSIANVENRVTATENDIGGLSTRVTTAESDITANSSDIMQLQTDLTQLENDVATKTHDSLTGRDDADQHPASSISTSDGLTSELTHTALRSILKSQGYTGVIGSFTIGFTINDGNDLGVTDSGSLWQYVGSDPLPLTVSAGTVPSSPDWVEIDLDSHNRLTGRNNIGAHDDIYNRRLVNLKDLSNSDLLNSLTDGSKFEITSFYSSENTNGGVFIWDESKSKADHNGGTIISPESLTAWDGTHEDLSTLLGWSGTGTGCFLRVVPPATDIDLEWFGAVLDDNTKSDSLSFSSAYSLATSSKSGIVWKGDFSFDSTLVLDSNVGVTLSGVRANRQSGNIAAPSRMIWTGTTTPMMSLSSTLNTFKDFAVENRGSATCWQSLLTGSINQIYQRLYFLNVTAHTPFSEAVILSNGARLGYSQFKNIIATQPSENFILIKDSSTTGLTPFSFTDRCIFRAATTAFNVVKVENSTLEGVKFDTCTFIQVSGEMVVVDTTTSPTAQTINVLTTVDCEFDTDTGGANTTDRFYKVENVANIIHDGNNHTKGGQGSVYSLVNSNVSRFQGNYGRSLNYFFTADDSSRVRGIGYNDLDWSSVDGIVDNSNCSVESLTQQTIISIDGTGWGPSEVAYYECDLTQDIPYTFALDISKPQNMEAGQIFYLTLKNTSGGSVQNPLFSSGTIKSQITPAPVSPANNRQNTLGFRFNGTHAVQITQQTPDCSI